MKTSAASVAIIVSGSTKSIQRQSLGLAQRRLGTPDKVPRYRAMLRAAPRSCKAGTSPSVCCTLLLASLTVVLVVVASSSAPPVAAADASAGFGSLRPHVFTNSFLVKLRGVTDRQQADLIARRNGFENWGSVITLLNIYIATIHAHCIIYY